MANGGSDVTAETKAPAGMAGEGFTGDLPKDQWRIDVSDGVAYISTTGRNGFREYFAALLVPRDPKDQVALDNLKGSFAYAVDGASAAPQG